MFSPERRKPSRWQNLWLQATAAVTGTFALLALANSISARLAQDEVKQQVTYNRLHDQLSLERAVQARMVPTAYTSEGQLVLDTPTLILAYPDKPLHSLTESVKEHQNRSHDLTSLGGLALFVMGSGAVTRLAERRRQQAARQRQTRHRNQTGLQWKVGITRQMPVRLAIGNTLTIGESTQQNAATHIGVLSLAEAHAPVVTLSLTAQANLDPVPPREEIDQRYVRKFEPTIYYSEAYDTQWAVFNEMMDRPYECSFTDRVGHRIRNLLMSRRTRLEEQANAATAYNPYATYHNTIELISLSAPPSYPS